MPEVRRSSVPNTQPTFKRERAGDRKPFKPKPWSHQDDLRALKGKTIDIVFLGGREAIKGTLLDSDQFALKVEIQVLDKQSVLTVYKHDMRYFRAG